MRKYVLLIILSIVCIQDMYASHTKGGWMYYEYLGPGTVDPSKLKYRIGLNYYVECLSTIPENGWNFSFFSGTFPYNFIQNIAVTAGTIKVIAGCTIKDCYPCLDSIPPRCYEIRNYETIVELDQSPDGYIISKQRCCRIGGIINILSPSDDYGATYTITIPGFNTSPAAPMNSSPLFIFNDTAVVCGGSQFTLNFTATDLNGDSLVYSFVDAFDGASAGPPNPATASNPPYSSVAYALPYRGTRPLGFGVTINPLTGVISGIAPPLGEYVICVLVKEYRNGLYIGESRKELHLASAPCTPVAASSNFVAITCDGYTVNFTDNSTGGVNEWFWDFGDPASGPANTSTFQNPTHTFSDTGLFNIKLRVSISGLCVDSVIKPIRVYPSFLPGFLISPLLCVNTPIQFTDTTYSTYGIVDSWRWDFGVPLPVDSDTSHLQNPVYTYTTPGTYTVELFVTNSKGCSKIYTKEVIINGNPLLAVFPVDSVYCGLDTLQLTGNGTGSFNWTPPIFIIGANTATPQVFPPVQTKYYAKLTDANGCISIDSLIVTPKFDLSNAIAGPIGICEEDTVTLTGSSNYTNNITWQWTPVGSVETPTTNITRVYPITTTTYTLNTRWGNNCVTAKTHTINVTQLAIANAGPDAFVCGGGQTFTQLNASGGISYVWTPVTGLSNPNIRNPIASPTVPTQYVVAVGVAGCPKLRTDTVFVNVGVLPVINSLNDTLICIVDTLQLTTSGTGNFLWSPNYMISSTTVASPLVSPDVPTWYYLQLTDAAGCLSADSVFVDVRDSVSLKLGGDTTICQTDAVLLNITSDALYYQWTPSTYLNFDNIKQPLATPLTTITYQVTGSIGKCQKQDEVTITVVPYPVANAGPDSRICSGFSTQLNATGGSIYAWSPATFLNNSRIKNPVSIRPTANIRYIVTVREVLGCPKPVKDTVWVLVSLPVIADAGPRDTSVVSGEPLLLHGTGGISYTWTPATWLNNPASQDPVSLPGNSIEYILTVADANGCLGTDRINVNLFLVDPDMYVPNAFTPNGDDKNNVLRPILLGMKRLTYFRVYNRWGVLMFSTSEKDKGWDGRYNGKTQDPATFVWMAEGINYKGETRRKKGYAVLIR